MRLLLVILGEVTVVKHCLCGVGFTTSGTALSFLAVSVLVALVAALVVRDAFEAAAVSSAC